MANPVVDQFEEMRDRGESERNRALPVGEDTYYASIFSGVTAFATGEGLVIVDSGTAAGSPVLDAMVREHVEAPLHTAILTHGHVDHAYGVHAFMREDQPRPRVVAHEAMEARFRRYERTAGHNRAINARQFAGDVEGSLGGEGSGGEEAIFGYPEVGPNLTFREGVTLTVGELTFEVVACRGETDDAAWVYCPERDVLCTGDLFISVLPNAGNPQKVQRYPGDWAEGLRAMAARRPGTLCPGHGDPVVDEPDRIRTMLLETADFLEALVDRTLEVLNDGSPPHVDIVRAVDPPASDAPWLQPLYDEAEFIVRNIVRYYGGWWSGRPSELKPAARGALAREIAGLTEGAGALAERARERAEEGNVKVACHLADYALEAAPDDPAVREAVASIYEQRAGAAPSLMASNLYRSAAAYAKDGRPYR